MLEEDEGLIRQIYSLIEENPRYDDHGIYKLLEPEEKTERMSI